MESSKYEEIPVIAVNVYSSSTRLRRHRTTGGRFSYIDQGCKVGQNQPGKGKGLQESGDGLSGGRISGIRET